MEEPYRRIGGYSEYLVHSLISSSVVLALEDFKDYQSKNELVLGHLQRFRGCLRPSSVFLDYIALRRDKKDYERILEESRSSLSSAEQEVRENKPGQGIEATIKLADVFGDFCVEDADKADKTNNIKRIIAT